MEKCYGLIGEHLGHSFSPQIHRMLGGYAYSLYELAPDEVAEFVKSGPLAGMNVTIPYKKTVLPLCDTLSDAARAIGSVNTVVRRPDGSLYGDNTDYYGFIWLLRSAGLDPRGKKVLVLGSGGASLTVQAAAKALGAREVVVISRTGENHYGNLERHADAQMIFNTTPVGMYPEVDRAPLSLEGFPECCGVADLIYNPANTRLLLDAQARRIPCAGGLGMLAAQAKAAAELFLGQEIPEARVGEIVRRIERQTKNIVLVGMPGCGKSTVGRLIARELERSFADTDELVERRCGCTIPELFARQGEAAFRALEHQVLAEIAKESGMVIATGGGIVTNPDNLSLLRQNSVTVYLRRSLSTLPREGRPLSLSGDLTEMLRRREPLYRAFSDFSEENRTPEQAARDIIKGVME